MFTMNGVVMESPCPQCKGRREITRDNGDHMACEKCAKKGRILTPAGREFMEFVANHLRADVSTGVVTSVELKLGSLEVKA